ncbi:MAG: MBL fold metallo-hydrolase [Candidatus Melainabacteria bacterium]|nr:MBL fold metallo-hydrolase [Candidatus Melainabacteria bacterium]
MKITFHGAAREVTGSCHLLESKGTKILIDCGLFQGSLGAKKANRNISGFKPKEIDYLLLTHAHLDHCGRIPLLCKNGFDGKVMSNAASRELAKLVMLDSAHLQEEDAKRIKHETPLYTTNDVFDAMSRFDKDISYGQSIQLNENITATYYDAGHVLGSSFIELEVKEGSKKYKVIFSGDLGNSGKPIVRNPAIPPNADIVVIESTYGNRLHKPIDVSIVEFYDAINKTFNRGGNVFIPSFAIERSQELLFFLREGVESGALPQDMKVFLDSPMAISATEIFTRHPECYDQTAQQLLLKNINPFTLPNLTYSRTVDDSKAINDIKSGAVIIAGSGMCNGGRILHHMKNNLPKKENCFIFVNYAPQDSLPHRIITGIRPIRIYGEEVPVNAEIITIGGFSAHADQKELIGWQNQTGSPRMTFLTHGSDVAMEAMAGRLRAQGFKTEIPTQHETFKI